MARPIVSINRINETTLEVVTECVFCQQNAIVIVNENEYNKWQDGELVQRAFPSMNKHEREMLISGTHPHCWDEMFADDKD